MDAGERRDRHRTRWHHLRGLLKPDPRYVANQMAREWFTPADWNTLRLPEALFFLYPVLRPAGWIVRQWRGHAAASTRD
jgi:hypothetical protein